MTNLPENFMGLTPAPVPDLTVFPFLKKRYSLNFFNQIVNGYFLFLLEDSSRLKWDSADNFDKFLEMVFNPELIDANCFSPYFLHGFIYHGPKWLKESNEITMLESVDRFFLSSKYTRLKQSKFDEEQIKIELLRMAGLLVIHTRTNFNKPTQPRFIVGVKNGVNFCKPDIVQESLSKYKKECAIALKTADSVKAFGRTYTPIVHEYFEFIDFTIKNCKSLLNGELKKVLSRWHQQFKYGKIDNGQNMTDGFQSISGPLHYLKGRPSGSAQNK